MAVTAAAFLTIPPPGGDPVPIVHAQPPAPDYYLAHDRGGHIDHHVLYFGLDPEAIEHLRRADVLLLGNSRLMFAARPGVLDPFFEARGLRYYVLGFGFREADRFPLAIIEKFDLRPRWVIVNADGFFLDELSEFAQAIMEETPFRAWQQRQEAEVSHDVRRALHLLAPNWLDVYGRPGFPSRRELIIYRSRTTGTWQLSPWPTGTTLVPRRDLSQPPIGRDQRGPAERFKAAMDQRGSRLLLTYVPTPRPLAGGPALFADLLNVPLLAPSPPRLFTEDDDHLDETSAAVWSAAFVRELGRVLQ